MDALEELRRIASEAITSPLLAKILRTVIAVALLYLVYRLVVHYSRLATKRLKKTTKTIIETALRYVFFVIGVMYVLGIFGVNLNALLGAAGIAGITIGFAAQTSVSNIISGFFLLSEKVFKIGDYIDVDGIAGSVETVDFLSVKLKTTDGQLLRIPNEAIIKANTTNYSFYPIRRLLVRVRVSYGTDLQKALDALTSIPPQVPQILSDPAPLTYIDTFDDSGVALCLGIWLDRNLRWAVQNAVSIAIHRTFAAAGIKYGSSRCTVVAGEFVESRLSGTQMGGVP